jgi:hypothetical protein
VYAAAVDHRDALGLPEELRRGDVSDPELLDLSCASALSLRPGLRVLPGRLVTLDPPSRPGICMESCPHQGC